MSGFPTGAVIMPLCIGLSTGLSEASWPDVPPDVPPDAPLLVIVFVLPTSSGKGCCCGALGGPVDA